ncbi:hypothetical protein CLPUN_09490 [Clostridium puniceum]|uniref:Uncharacterized protein n=1 Tax=Clostridium puniceum TaxID=29367 RepID=A0A1S8TWK3_9CLOT|nr:hypothetical protein [Clostridium puniceum]OOM81765.1 hypothetical protein CLPUN_09490 [Clostridium puniceum]
MIKFIIYGSVLLSMLGILKYVEKSYLWKAPRAVIDITFVKTLRVLNSNLGYQRFHSAYPTPTFIEEILEKCESECNMKFIEYIIYLKVCQKQMFFHHFSKKKKDIIIKEISNKFHIRIDYEILQTYLNASFNELAENLGYELEMKFAKELVLKE